MRKKWQQIETLIDPVTPVNKEALKRYLEYIPDDFWTAPASSTGRHHPPFALGVGGLLRHTEAMARVAGDLVTPYNVDPEIVYIACICHDTYKGGLFSPWDHTDPHHPLLAYVTMIEFDLPVEAAIAVLNHMTLWGPSKKTIPQLDPISQVVATADYIVSQRYFRIHPFSPSPANTCEEEGIYK